MASNIKVIQPGAQPFASDINQVVQAFSGQSDLDQPILATQAVAPGAPTVAVGSSGSLTGTYKYQLVYVTGWVDSYYNMYVAGFAPSAETTITLTAQNANVTIPVFNLPIIGALIYRTAAGGATGTEKYVGMVMQNTGATFVDSVPDANIGVPPTSGIFNTSIPASVPTVNTTGTTLQLGSSVNSLNGNIVMSLLVPKGNGVGLDIYGNLKVINPSTVVANGAWTVSDKNNAAILTVLLDGTKVVKTVNNTLDNGSGSATFTGTVQGTRLISTIATGTAPFSVTSTTVVTNLNADMVDGYHMNQGVQTTDSPTFAGLTVNSNATFASSLYMTGSGYMMPKSGGSIGFVNNAANAWALRVVDSATPNTYTFKNTLDDGAGNMTAVGKVTSTTGGFGGLGRISAYSWSGNIASGGSVRLTHNLGYNPIVSYGLNTSSAGGNYQLTFRYVDYNNVDIGNFNGGANTANVIAYLW